MKTLSRWISEFCSKHPNLGIPDLIKYIAVGNVIVFVGDMVTQGMLSQFVSFYPELILRGQIWRLITFVFAPLPVGGESMLSQTIFGRTFLFALMTFFYYWIGTSLERQWGSTRFTVFYGLGVLFNIAAGMILYLSFPFRATGALLGYYVETANMYYVNMSLFFSFATLYPDMQVNLYGIIPLKVKWLALIDLVFFGYAIVSPLMSGQWLWALMPIVAILNYLIFFWEDLINTLGYKRAQVRHRTSAQTINFKKAQKELRERRGYLHKCAVCGVTDQDDPNMEFRYCSKCSGYYCYCANHINNHSHVQ